MLTFSILWVMLAAAVTGLALVRRATTDSHDYAEPQAKELGNVVTFLAVLSSLLLVAGFIYVGGTLVLNL